MNPRKQEIQNLIGTAGRITRFISTGNNRYTAHVEMRQQILGSALYWCDIAVRFVNNSADYYVMHADVSCDYIPTNRIVGTGEEPALMQKMTLKLSIVERTR